MPYIDKKFAEDFAQDWVAAWNAHDLNRVLSHYAENFEMNSPIITRREGRADGRLIGKSNVRTYWAKALIAYPNLSFELINTFFGPQSITILYKGALGNPVCETFIFEGHQVVRVFANYLEF